MWWFSSSLPSNVCSSVADRVPMMELYTRFWYALRLGGIPIGFEKLLSLGFWSYHRFANIMAKGQEETSTSHVGRRRGPSRESPIASSLVSSMSVEELRFFC